MANNGIPAFNIIIMMVNTFILLEVIILEQQYIKLSKEVSKVCFNVLILNMYKSMTLLRHKIICKLGNPHL